jgi:hypothetical protein
MDGTVKEAPVKRVVVPITLLLLAQLAVAATVVLKGGKRLEVATFEQQGNYLVVMFEDGRAQSYPVSMVDMAATDEANGVTRPQRPSPAAPGPSSPFLSAVARKGEAVATIRDGDVAKVLSPESEATEEPKQQRIQAPARVVVTGYNWKLVGENTWEVTVNLANQGEFAASNLSVQVRGLDANGEETGRATGTLTGELAPGAQASTVVTLKGEEAVVQLAFDVRWQEIRLAAPPREEVTPITAPATAPPSAPAQAAPPQYGLAPGASPMAVPENPLALRDVTAVPQPVPPATPPPS